jgi:biopolymer transport protein ExbB
MKNTFSAVLSAAFLTLLSLPSSAQNGAGGKRYAVFEDGPAPGVEWTGDEKSIRDGGFTRNSEKYLYLRPTDTLTRLTGLAIPIRENPKRGEYRYVTFAWVKWGGHQIGLRFLTDSSGPGAKYDYTYYSGEIKPEERDGKMVVPVGNYVEKGLLLDETHPGGWRVVTRDLWKDFGDFTLTGLEFICPDRRDAGFDAIFLGQTDDVFDFAPGVLPDEVAQPVEFVDDDNLEYTEYQDPEAASQKVKIDWAAQIKAGGSMMYPLYLLAIVALVIGIQRWNTAGERNFAPKKLRKELRKALAENDLQAATKACEQYPSTLSESISFILKHRKAGREIVSQTAGDIAARDIRTQLNKIFPLSVIASLAPLLGLLGTIVGMIEAFGLVALYGDEGGASILSDSISKALITTAAGLIIAAPCVAVYFLIKNRIMRNASVIEVEVETLLTALYLSENEAENE